MCAMASNSYHMVRKDGKTQYAHRIITSAPEGMVVDHINGDTRDNRPENLRLCTQAENIRARTRMNKNNSSGHRGVYKDKKGWRAAIKVNRKYIHLGCFKTIEEAATAAREARVRYFGEFAGLV